MDRQSFSILYQKYLSGICTPDELEAFHRFMMLPEAEAILRDLLRETYSGIRNYSATVVDTGGKLIAPPETNRLPRLLPRKTRMRRARNVAFGTVASVVAGLAVWLAWDGSIKPVRRDLPARHSSLTARSEFKKLVLPDSTIVWLNAGSRLDFPAEFGPVSREVTLSGEASFDVSHAPEHPFLIHTGRIVTRVLGTAFNINAYPGQRSVTVSVSRGKVEVSRDNETLATLIKGQELQVDGQTNDRPLRKIIPVSSVAAWQRGYLNYDDESLQEVVADLGRVFNVDIRVVNPRLRNLRISTRLRREDGLAQTLEVIGKLTESQITFRDNLYFIQ